MGIRGLLIDFGKQTEVPCTDLAVGACSSSSTTSSTSSGRGEQIQYVRTIVEQGTGAERQLAVYRATNDLRAVMDYVARRDRARAARAGPLERPDASWTRIYARSSTRTTPTPSIARVCALMEERLEEPAYGFRIAETPAARSRRSAEPSSRRAPARSSSCCCDPEMIAAGRAAVPERFHAPATTRCRSAWRSIFAIVREADGSLAPRLIELQGFPSLYAMQLLQAEIWGEVLCVDARYAGPVHTALHRGATARAYIDLLRRTVVADADVDAGRAPRSPCRKSRRPAPTSTRRDSLLGVRSVDATTVAPRGRRLLAPKDGRMVPVARVYNRIVFDELEKRAVEASRSTGATIST